jgi:rhodanese-related sulfurtransferase
MEHIRPEQLNAWLSDTGRGKPVLLDVRENWEFQTAHIAGSVLIPMGGVSTRHAELDPQAEIVVICHHGGRSMQVAGFLEHKGFSKVYNLTGGVNAWARTVDPSMPTY